MISYRTALAVGLTLGSMWAALAACGARTELAQGQHTPDAALPDAEAPRPCHLVQIGEPFRSIVGPTPTSSFRQDGLLGRASTSRVVQFGDVEGLRTGVWQDPPIFAAEYDVTTWPPVAVHPAAQWAESMHQPADLLELPAGRLGLTFWFDNDGLGPSGVRYRSIDAPTFQPGAERFLVENVTVGVPPVLTTGALATVIRRTSAVDGGAKIESRLELFELDGAARAEKVPLWSSTGAVTPSETLAQTRTELLVALAFAQCDGVTAAPCEPGAIVVSRVRTDGTPRLEKVSSVPLQGATRLLSAPHLLTDLGAQTWLTWWETTRADAGAPQMYLFGIPLTAAGTVDGPVESWWVGTDVYVNTLDARQIECGPLGTLYPVRRVVTSDGDARSETHFVHRQLGASAEIEELVVTTRSTYFPPVGVAVAKPRGFVIGDSDSTAGVSGFGELRKYVCAEDGGRRRRRSPTRTRRST